MSAVTILPMRPDGWTVPDLDLLPDDPPFHYELVDGALIVSPPPGGLHNYAANELGYLLRGVVGAEWAVLSPGSIEFDVRNWREPDVLVVTRECLRERKYPTPGDALLAVEVMSPTSVGTDRISKPAQFAAAGIPHYWRYEPDQPAFVSHVLSEGVYRETGRFTDEVAVDIPVTLRFRLADLLP
jgi:Uma2 family endonuclease